MLLGYGYNLKICNWKQIPIEVYIYDKLCIINYNNTFQHTPNCRQHFILSSLSPKSRQHYTLHFHHLIVGSNSFRLL